MVVINGGFVMGVMVVVKKRGIGWGRGYGGEIDEEGNFWGGKGVWRWC